MNGNGICDDEEECLGTVDECGVCDGPGAIYECGCSDIPEGDCDCDGNQLDALACAVVTALPTSMPMASATTSTTAWALDECGICNGPGTIYGAGVQTSLKETATATEPARRLGRVRRRLRSGGQRQRIVRRR